MNSDVYTRHVMDRREMIEYLASRWWHMTRANKRCWSGSDSIVRHLPAYSIHDRHNRFIAESRT
jgi:hypothetical protein